MFAVKFDFPLEPIKAIRIVRERLRKDFERHVSVELGVPRSIHLAHAAFADLGGDLVVSKNSNGPT